MKKHLFTFLSFSLVGLIGLLVYFFNLSHQSFSEKELPLTGFSKKLNFHPDAVIEFSFQTYNEEKIFKRNNRLGKWNGHNHSPNSIQDRLSFLSSVKAYPIDKIPNAVIKIKLKHENHEVWNISSNGEIIRFENGPLAGQGGRLGTQERSLFLTGSKSFKDEKIKWCSSSPTSISLNGFKIVKKKNEWIKLDKTGRHISSIIDGQKVKKWIDKNCFLYSDRILDNRLLTPDLHNVLAFEFSNNKKDEVVKIQWNTDNIIKIGNEMKFIYHEDLAGELNDLVSLLR